MLTKEKILKLAKKKGKILTNDITAVFDVSRQYASNLINSLAYENKLIKFGQTKNAFYVLPEYAKRHSEIFPIRFVKKYKNVHLEEHKVLDEIEEKLPLLKKLPENVRSIFTYAFSEMLNNAIEHSHSTFVSVEVLILDNVLSFTVNDSGMGVFKSVLNKKKLGSALEAIGEILKGKITTMPKSHSGEGIFFTSRAGDEFALDSYGDQLIFNNKLSDVFINQPKKLKKGTRVIFKITTNSPRHLNEIFKEYSDLNGQDNYGFDKTEIRVRLYSIGGVYISRSQARRILSSLEKFKVISFDYAEVPVIGQAFADEVYRVFQKKYPHIRIEEINMNEAVKFMIERAKTEARKDIGK